MRSSPARLRVAQELDDLRAGADGERAGEPHDRLRRVLAEPVAGHRGGARGAGELEHRRGHRRVLDADEDPHRGLRVVLVALAGEAIGGQLEPVELGVREPPRDVPVRREPQPEPLERVLHRRRGGEPEDDRLWGVVVVVPLVAAVELVGPGVDGRLQLVVEPDLRGQHPRVGVGVEVGGGERGGGEQRPHGVGEPLALRLVQAREQRGADAARELHARLGPLPLPACDAQTVLRGAEPRRDAVGVEVVDQRGQGQLVGQPGPRRQRAGVRLARRRLGEDRLRRCARPPPPSPARCCRPRAARTRRPRA